MEDYIIKFAQVNMIVHGSRIFSELFYLYTTPQLDAKTDKASAC